VMLLALYEFSAITTPSFKIAQIACKGFWRGFASRNAIILVINGGNT